MKDLFNENYKTLVKETEEETKGKIFYAHGLDELILLKDPCYPKQFTNLMQSMSEFPMVFFIELEQF